MPSNPLTDRAFAHMKEREYDEAIKNFTAALQNEREPEVRLSIYSARALAYRSAGKFIQSIADYSAAIGLQTRDSWEPAADYISRAEVYLEIGDHESALADYRAATRVEPRNASIYSSRADYYVAQQQWDAAIADYSMILEIYPGVIDILLQRGTAYTAIGSWDRAIKDFTLCIRNDTNEDAHYKGLAHKLRAQAYLVMSKITQSNSKHYIEGAIIDYEQYLSYIPEAEDRAEIEVEIAQLRQR